MAIIKKLKINNTEYDVGPTKTSDLTNDSNFAPIVYGKRSSTGFVSGTIFNNKWLFASQDLTLVKCTIYFDVTTMKAYTYDGKSLDEFYVTAELIQSDWNQTNSSSKDYIKNKPEILSATYDIARTALVIDIPSVTEQLIEQELSNL